MKTGITFIFMLCASAIFSQTSAEYLQAGIEKHKQNDYTGAIKDYDKAIKADKENVDAYFNRGNCELGLKDYKGAMSDFTKVIELNPKFVKAYYNRASVYVSQQKYTEALPDLDMAIELSPTTPNALALRGQIRVQTGNKTGGCEDFNKAKEAGDKTADKYISQFCGSDAQAGEELKLDWPDSENWKVGSNQEDAKMVMVELVRGNETLEDWTEIGTMTVIKNVKNVPMDKAMNIMYEQSKEKAPKSKLTFIEKDETAEYPWAIFTIESPSFKDSKTPESQLWYIVQGKTALYTNFRAIKQATIPADLKDKWIKFFKTAKVVAKK